MSSFLNLFPTEMVYTALYTLIRFPVSCMTPCIYYTRIQVKLLFSFSVARLLARIKRFSFSWRPHFQSPGAVSPSSGSAPLPIPTRKPRDRARVQGAPTKTIIIHICRRGYSPHPHTPTSSPAQKPRCTPVFKGR